MFGHIFQVVFGRFGMSGGLAGIRQSYIYIYIHICVVVVFKNSPRSDFSCKRIPDYQTPPWSSRTRPGRKPFGFKRASQTRPDPGTPKPDPVRELPDRARELADRAPYYIYIYLVGAVSEFSCVPLGLLWLIFRGATGSLPPLRTW